MNLCCCRGKAGKLQGNLAGCLAVLKGTPTTYNKDFQEVGGVSGTHVHCRAIYCTPNFMQYYHAPAHLRLTYCT